MINFLTIGAVAVIELARPPVNALDEDFVDAINAALSNPELESKSVLCFRSRQKVFAAGADLAFLGAVSQRADYASTLQQYLEKIQQLFLRIELLPCITVAEIGGAALGAGFELALSCDFRVMANEAKVGLPETGIGLLPAAGGTQRLTRLAGRGAAARLIYAGETVNGEAALAMGVADYCVPKADLNRFTDQLLKQLATKPANAMQAVKECVRAQGAAGADGYALERSHAVNLLGTQSTQALITQFLDKSQRR